MKRLNELVRQNILRLEPYGHERSSNGNKTGLVLLDANENPYNTPYNRYPEIRQTELKRAIAKMKKLPAECILLSNGADEAADIIYRCFAEPGRDNVVAIEPTCRMYERLAEINNVEYRKAALDENFQLSAGRVLAACNGNTKVIWLCSPNDPTGNELQREEIIRIINGFEGLVVVDEAYSDFSSATPLRHELYKYPNLIVLDTFSNSWGCAGLRLGTAFAFPEIIDILNKVRNPYNVNTLTQESVSKLLDRQYDVEKWVNILLAERERMVEAFRLLPSCKKVYPTETNFFLAQMTDAKKVYDHLKGNGILVKSMAGVPLCEDCLRITVGSKSENSELLAALRLLKTEEE